MTAIGTTETFGAWPMAVNDRRFTTPADHSARYRVTGSKGFKHDMLSIAAFI